MSKKINIGTGGMVIAQDIVNVASTDVFDHLDDFESTGLSRTNRFYKFLCVKSFSIYLELCLSKFKDDEKSSLFLGGKLGCVIKLIDEYVILFAEVVEGQANLKPMINADIAADCLVEGDMFYRIQNLLSKIESFYLGNLVGDAEELLNKINGLGEELVRGIADGDYGVKK